MSISLTQRLQLSEEFLHKSQISQNFLFSMMLTNVGLKGKWNTTCATTFMRKNHANPCSNDAQQPTSNSYNRSTATTTRWGGGGTEKSNTARMTGPRGCSGEHFCHAWQWWFPQCCYHGDHDGPMRWLQRKASLPNTMKTHRAVVWGSMQKKPPKKPHAVPTLGPTYFTTKSNTPSMLITVWAAVMNGNRNSRVDVWKMKNETWTVIKTLAWFIPLEEF